MPPKSITTLSILPLAMSQTTTLQVPFYGYDTFSIDASVLGVQDSLTTMTLACPSSAEECGLFPTQILTYGPSSYRMTMGADADFTGYQDCNVAQSVCTESAGGPGANFPGMSTTTYDDAETFAVTVTWGVEKLSGGGGAAETGAGTMSASAGASETTTASVTLITGTSGASGMGTASRTQSAAAETSSGTASGMVVAQGGVVGSVFAMIALLL
ncbi:hypothetical protein CB0940_03807 [Cercospora beticola]|uniref:Uncharacterized protein n=1 Tax=Cercospora beticola TaxID=122368 RepID=A0A2G5I565_CERBT|nr:hypothetical protein CB0940_03807 [Cercospora beticola]PIA99946.1 hypothetical protein CB0940_03807 [Cercospora beticola]WPB01000.1 hypothetical protein RHO25_005620 [Cercospora beticola]CAK1360735.1 unnamed protein product [Cercospora beticola]